MKELTGTGYMVQVMIDSYRGTTMEELEFSLEFYVYPNRRDTFRKSDLLSIGMEHGTQYVAMLDTRRLGSGPLMCDVRISDPESRFPGGSRPVLLKCNTGKRVGGGNQTVYPGQTEWVEGYKVDFNFLWSLPKPEVAYIFYGHLVNQLTSYAEITSDMLVSPDNHIVNVSAGKMGKTSCGIMKEGDKVVVLIPSDTSYTATKDNGFGGQMAFSTAILGSNGENLVTIDGVQYRAYGEMMTTEGEMFIYVN